MTMILSNSDDGEIGSNSWKSPAFSAFFVRKPSISTAGSSPSGVVTLCVWRIMRIGRSYSGNAWIS